MQRGKTAWQQHKPYSFILIKNIYAGLDTNKSLFVVKDENMLMVHRTATEKTLVC